MCGATVGILQPRKFTLIEGLGKEGGLAHTDAVAQSRLQRAPWERRPGLGWLAALHAGKRILNVSQQKILFQLHALNILPLFLMHLVKSSLTFGGVWRLTFALQPQNGERKPELYNTEG